MTLHLQENWFCSAECSTIHDKLRIQVAAGPQPAGQDYVWQLYRGKEAFNAGTTWALKAAHEIMQEGFDPIVDAATGADLIQIMVYAQQAGDWDYTGAHAIVLRHRVRAGSCP